MFRLKFCKVSVAAKRKVEKWGPFQFVFDKVYMKAVEVLEEKLVMSSVLTLPLENGQYNMDFDACDTFFTWRRQSIKVYWLLINEEVWNVVLFYRRGAALPLIRKLSISLRGSSEVPCDGVVIIR